MNKSCALCIDNAGSFRLEILTTFGTTGAVPVCHPCLRDRLDDLMHDLTRADDEPENLGGVIGFTVEMKEEQP